MKPGDWCPSCGGLGKLKQDPLRRDRLICTYCPHSERMEPTDPFGAAITRALQGEPGAEVIEPSWKVDEAERQRLAERFRTKGIMG